MPDDLALRAYRSELDNQRRNAQRAASHVRYHLDTIDAWLDQGYDVPPPLLNLGTDVAALIQAASALKTLRDAAYLAEEN